MLDRFAPARLRCLQFTSKLRVGGGLRGSERRCYLLLNLIGSREQRLALRRGRFFPLPRSFLKRSRRCFCARNNLRFRLLRLGPQPGGRFFCLPANGSQILRRAFQLLGVLVALGCAFLRETRRQLACELLKLWRQ